MKILTVTLGMVLAAASGMAHAATHEHDLSKHPISIQTTPDPVKHEGSGVLKAVNAKEGKVQIAHDAIADLGWPRMTMWFALRAPLPGDVHVGDTVRFELLQTETKQWAIVRIVRK